VYQRVPVLAVFSIRTSWAASRRLPVVVMQAIEDWECHGQTVCLGRSRHRLFLPKALIGELGSRSPRRQFCAGGDRRFERHAHNRSRTVCGHRLRAQGWRMTLWCPHFACLLARLEGFEPPTHGFDSRMRPIHRVARIRNPVANYSGWSSPGFQGFRRFSNRSPRILRTGCGRC